MKCIDLQGSWRFSLDYDKVGIRDQWYDCRLNNVIHLPGTTDEAHYGAYCLEKSLGNFTRKYRYDGFAWYQRDILITDDMVGKKITLFLESVNWDSFVWIDDQYYGTRNSLLAPHEYDLSNLSQGKHVLTIMVDNSNMTDGWTDVEHQSTFEDRDLTLHVSDKKKLNCGGHHYTFRPETIWNGIVGKIELRVEPVVSISYLDVFCNVETNQTQVKVMIENGTCRELDLALSVQNYLLPCHENWKQLEWSCDKALHITASKQETYLLEFDLDPNCRLWDEYAPNLYEMEVCIHTNEEIQQEKEIKSVVYGIRTLSTREKQLLLNGVPIFLRGTLESCIFPLTAYPPVDPAYWEKIYRTLKLYGMNHIRFHTWCPPEVAFAVADREGIYLQVEIPGTSCPSEDEDDKVTEYLTDELVRMLKYYGHHPSLCFVSMGNEQLVCLEEHFLKEHTRKLTEKVALGKKLDNRHLYTCTSHPYSDRPEDDFFVTAWTKHFYDIIADPTRTSKLLNKDWLSFLTSITWGGPDPTSKSRYCLFPPNTLLNSTTALEGIDKPVVAHEMGQWMVYPNVEEIEKYDGVLYPGNLVHIKEDLKAKGMLDRLDAMVQCSGKLSYQLYKEDIETCMRTANISGFQLLGLYDYPGQGTSMVGMLDSMWDSKGIITSDQFKSFCNDKVLLLEFEKYEWNASEVFHGQVKVANYSKEQMTDETIEIMVANQQNEVLYTAVLSDICAPNGMLTDFGGIDVHLSQCVDPAIVKITLKAVRSNIENSWEIFVSAQTEDEPNDVVIVHDLTQDVMHDLIQGKHVLWLLDSGSSHLDDVCFTSTFWNPRMKEQVGTNGLMIASDHSIFEWCPTKEYTQWFHWDMLNHAKCVCIDSYQNYFDNIMAVVDNFIDNRHLSMLMETRVGAGKLMITSIDLFNEDKGLYVQQLRHAILQYMQSSKFEPAAQIDETTLSDFVSLLKNTSK